MDHFSDDCFNVRISPVFMRIQIYDFSHYGSFVDGCRGNVIPAYRLQLNITSHYHIALIVRWIVRPCPQHTGLTAAGWPTRPYRLAYM